MACQRRDRATAATVMAAQAVDDVVDTRTIRATAVKRIGEDLADNLVVLRIRSHRILRLRWCVSRGGLQLLCRGHCNRRSHDRSRTCHRRMSYRRRAVQQLADGGRMQVLAVVEAVLRERAHVVRVASRERSMTARSDNCRLDGVRRASATRRHGSRCHG